MNEEQIYLCVGICQPDPDSGYCLGCGRPPLDTPDVAIVHEPGRASGTPPVAGGGDPDTPA